MSEYTFSEDGYSDLYKDVYGFRPKNSLYHDLDDDMKQEIWDGLLLQLEEVMADEKHQEEQNVQAFKELIQISLSLGAKDETQALRWMIQNDDLQHSQEVEQYVWEHGILFTQYGRDIVQKINKILF